MKEEEPVLHFASRDQLREWLQANCRAVRGCWVVCSRSTHVPSGVLPYLDVVEEALCFGWIDSTCKREGEILRQRLSPRRKGSRWTELNKEHCRRLERLGLMTDEGRRVLPDLDTNSFKIDDDIMQVLQEDVTVWRNFRAFHPLYQRVKIENIQIKRGTPLFESRLKRLIDSVRRNLLYGEWNDKGRLLTY